MLRATIREIFYREHSEHTVSKCLIYNGCKHRCSQHVSYTWPSKNDSEVYCVDCFAASGNKPDEFIFLNAGKPGNDTTGLYLVERKSNSNNVTKVKTQLQGGADFMDSFISRNSSTFRGCQIVFLPVLVSKGIKPSARNALRRETVTLWGQGRQVRWFPAGKRAVLPHIP